MLVPTLREFMKIFLLNIQPTSFPILNVHEHVCIGIHVNLGIGLPPLVSFSILIIRRLRYYPMCECYPFRVEDFNVAK